MPTFDLISDLVALGAPTPARRTRVRLTGAGAVVAVAATAAAIVAWRPRRASCGRRRGIAMAFTTTSVAVTVPVAATWRTASWTTSRRRGRISPRLLSLTWWRCARHLLRLRSRRLLDLRASARKERRSMESGHTSPGLNHTDRFAGSEAVDGEVRDMGRRRGRGPRADHWTVRRRGRRSGERHLCHGRVGL